MNDNSTRYPVMRNPLASIVVVLFLLLAMLSVNREFHPDEFEALKSAWKIADGERIYTDFFQHHHPLLYYLLKPLIRLTGDNPSIAIQARMIMLAGMLGIAMYASLCARLLYGRRAALPAIIILFCLPMFTSSALEIRADVPQTFFFFGCLYHWLRYRRKAASRDIVIAALLAALSFLFLQKIMVALATIAGIAAVLAFHDKRRWRDVLIGVVVFIALWITVVGILFAPDRLHEYLFWNFEFNLQSSSVFGHQIVHQARSAITFNMVVLLPVIYGLWRSRCHGQTDLIVLFTVTTLASALYPVQYPQYYMVPLVLLSILAANGFQFIQSDSRPLAYSLVLVMTFLPCLTAARELMMHRNDNQLTLVEHLVELTDPQDLILDSGMRFNLFRRDLDFFWFNVHPGSSLDVYRQLSGYHYDTLELVDRYQPVIINTNAISPEILATLADRYEPLPDYVDILIRRDRNPIQGSTQPTD